MFHIQHCLNHLMSVDAWPGRRIHTKYKMNDITIENLCDIDELEKSNAIKTWRIQWSGGMIYTKYKMNDIKTENLCDIDELENPNGTFTIWFISSKLKDLTLMNNHNNHSPSF